MFPRMCGRFTCRLTWPEIVRLYRLPLDTQARNTQARYNVCPTDPIDALTEPDL
jgi:putative SOS response-associated peptidase YedK